LLNSLAKRAIGPRSSFRSSRRFREAKAHRRVFAGHTAAQRPRSTSWESLVWACIAHRHDRTKLEDSAPQNVRRRVNLISSERAGFPNFPKRNQSARVAIPKRKKPAVSSEFLSGAYRDRTGDLRLAKPALSQLS
jgi:hypothetical protein